MKLNQIAEATKHGPKMTMLVTAAKELGIPVKLKKWDYYEEELNHYLQVLKNAGQKDTFATGMAVGVPINTLYDALKKLPEAPLHDIHVALRKLDGIGFIGDKMRQDFANAVATTLTMKELTEWVGRIQTIMHLIADIRNAAKNSKDEYHRSIATAVLKNLGLPLE